MATSTSSDHIALPITISKLAQRYLVYDVDVVTYLRREHNIIGVLIGSLPQAPQQNVFSGLPMELMPEEARLLVDEGVAHVVDDANEHRRKFLGNSMSVDERRAYQTALRKQGQGAARESSKRSDDRKKAALKKMETEGWNDIPEDMFKPGPRRGKQAVAETVSDAETKDDESLFSSRPAKSSAKSSVSRVASDASSVSPEAYAVTPTTSLLPPNVSEPDNDQSCAVPASYPLYKHMHNQGYFLAPGIRFGCQYMAYPGDPLRFHSHFLCRGLEWDQEFDLLDLVGGGRLGTGVKKGYLIGGQEPDGLEKGGIDSEPADGASSDKVRAFCIEWGGM